MSGHGEAWYLDRLRAELERVAAQQDAAERRRLRLPVPSWRRLVLPLAVVTAVALLFALGTALLGADDRERTAEPGPAPAPTAVPGDPTGDVLRRFDGVYIAEIGDAELRRLGTSDLPAGVWKIAINAENRTIEVSAPEGRDSGGYTLAITAATRDRLTFGPDRGCDVPEQRAQPASARLALTRAILTFQAVRGGCTSAWALLSAIPWRQA